MVVSNICLVKIYIRYIHLNIFVGTVNMFLLTVSKVSTKSIRIYGKTKMKLLQMVSFYLFIYLSIEHELNVDKSSGSTTRFVKTLTVACLKHKTIN